MQPHEFDFLECVTVSRQQQLLTKQLLVEVLELFAKAESSTFASTILAIKSAFIVKLQPMYTNFCFVTPEVRKYPTPLHVPSHLVVSPCAVFEGQEQPVTVCHPVSFMLKTANRTGPMRTRRHQHGKGNNLGAQHHSLTLLYIHLSLTAGNDCLNEENPFAAFSVENRPKT